MRPYGVGAALLLTLPLPAQLSAAETQNLSGTVVNASGGEAIPGAVVRIIETGTVTLVDGNGRFAFEPLPPGTYNVEVIAGGFHTESFRLTLSGDAPMVARLAVHAVGGGRGDVIVVRDRVETVEPVVRKITVEELQRIPGAFGDAVRAVQNLPGVARSPFGLGALIIRGTEPQDTGIYVDGIRVPLIFHFGGLTTTLNSDVLDRVEFIPGGFTARYGRQLGGVVDVATRDHIPLGLSTYADIDLFDTSLFVSTPIGDDHGLTFSARRSYIDLIVAGALKAVANNPAVQDGPELGAVQLPVYEDYQVMWDHHRGDHHRFHVMLFGSRDRFSIESGITDPSADPLIIEGGGAELSTINHKLLGIWTWVPTADLSTKLTLGLGPDANQISAGALEIDASPWSLFLRGDVRYELSPYVQLRGGLDGLLQWYDFSLEVPFDITSDDPLAEPEPTIISAQTLVTSPAVYAEGDVRLGAFTVTPGLRVDPYLVTDTEAGELLYTGLGIDPRLNARWRVSPETALKASVGKYSNGVQPFAFVSGVGGDDAPPLEWAFQSSLGIEQRFTQELGLSATAYWNEQRDLLVSGATSDADSTTDGGLLAAAGGGYSRGIELLLRHDPGARGFFGWVSYTLQQAERNDNLEAACNRWQTEDLPADCSPWYAFSFDQTHILTVVASQRLKKGWEVGLRFRYTTGSPYTPQEALYYDFDEDSYVATAGETNSQRYPAFHQLDLRVDKRWFKPWGEVAVGVELLNVYNRQNPEAILYNFDYSEESYVSGIPFFPAFGLKVKYGGGTGGAQ